MCYARVMTAELTFFVERAPEGGWTARAMAIPIFTEADTMDGLREMIRDAVHCHFDEGEAPRLVRLHIVEEELLAV